MALAPACGCWYGGTLLRKARGTQTSHARPGSSCANFGPVTPATVNSVLPIKTCLPTISGSLPNSFCQNLWLTTSAGDAVSESSFRSSRRPIIALTPSMGKKSPDTNSPGARFVRPSEFTVNSAGTNAARFEKIFRSPRSCWKNGSENEHPPASRGTSEVMSPPCGAGPLPGGQLA